MAIGYDHPSAMSIKVVVPFIATASVVERLRGVMDAVDNTEYDLVIYNIESVRSRNRHFSRLPLRERVDGVIVVSLAPTAEEEATFAAAGTRVVFVDAPAMRQPCVVSDDLAGSEMATCHLIQLGHRRIGFVGDEYPIGSASPGAICASRDSSVPCVLPASTQVRTRSRRVNSDLRRHASWRYASCEARTARPRSWPAAIPRRWAFWQPHVSAIWTCPNGCLWSATTMLKSPDILASPQSTSRCSSPSAKGRDFCWTAWKQLVTRTQSPCAESCQ